MMGEAGIALQSGKKTSKTSTGQFAVIQGGNANPDTIL
jgi:hypothetical protein